MEQDEGVREPMSLGSMQLTFLGTGTSQGVPVIACRCKVCTSADSRDRRLRTSALLSVEKAGAARPVNILFDIGPDFRQQMLRQEVDHLDAILVTHAHRDHVAGIDDIRPLNYVQHREMDLYMNAEARQALERAYAYIFQPHDYPGLPEARLHTVTGPFAVQGIAIEPIKAMHKDLPLLGYRIGRLAYLTDVSRIDEAEAEKLKGLDVLVVNALRIEKHWSHFCLSEALELIEHVAPRRAFLTHASHELGLQEEVEKMLPAGVRLAYDNLKVTL